MLAPWVAHGETSPEPVGTAPEFIDFLEYLGSWEGEEQTWVQFLDLAPLPKRDEAGRKSGQTEDDDDVVS